MNLPMMNLMKKIALMIIAATSIFISTTAQTPQSQHNQDLPTVKIPETILGKIVQEFISAINSGDEEKTKSFVQNYLSKDLSNVGPHEFNKQKYIVLMHNLQKQAQRIIPAELRQENSAEYIGITFQIESVNDRILSVEFFKGNDNTLRAIELHSIQMSKGPYQWTKEKLDSKGIAEAIDERVMKEVSADHFSGTVLIAKEGEVIFQKAYGYSDHSKNILNTMDTRFHTGSIGKMITATAVAQLVEKGKLKFTDTLGAILKDYPNKEAAENVTIHELLTHTSGIGDPFELGRRKANIHYSTASSNLPLFADAPLKMKPGAYHSYSNGNYAVLAAIAEVISGSTFEDYLKRNIFGPSGMKVNDIAAYSKLPRAISYTHDPANDPLGINSRAAARQLESEPEIEFSGFSNTYLTAEDVYRFLLALRQGKLVSPEMVENITKGKVDIQPGAPVKYAYGFYEANMWGVNMRGHSGGGSNSGIGADAEMIWKNNYYVVILGNYDLEEIRPLSLSIVRFLGTR